MMWNLIRGNTEKWDVRRKRWKRTEEEEEGGEKRLVGEKKQMRSEVKEKKMGEEYKGWQEIWAEMRRKIDGKWKDISKRSGWEMEVIRMDNVEKLW